MVWKVYFVNTCVIVSYFRRFHHVTLDQFDVYLHAWLYVYNMERRGVRFDHIYDEIDACLVWFRVLRTKLIFRQLFVAEFPFIIKNPTETVFTESWRFQRTLEEILTLCSQNSVCTDPKSGSVQTRFCRNRVCTGPIFHGKQCLRVLHTYFPSRYRPCIFENTESLYFRKIQGLYRLGEYVYNARRHCFPWKIGLGTNTVSAKPCLYRVMFWVGNHTVLGLYRPSTTWNRACTGPVRVFWKFRTDSIPALYCAFFDAVTARLQTDRVKKVSVPTPGDCTLPVHCRYIACFSRYWVCLGRYRACLSR